MSENAKRYAKPSTKTTTGGRSKTGSKEDGAKLSFNMTELRPLTDRQQDLFNAFSRDRNIIGYGSAGTGKAQPLNAKIAIPGGWKLMGDVKIGDQVIVPNGDISAVVGVFPQGSKDIYTVTFSDGSSTEACLEHLWECHVPKNMYNSVGNTKQIISTAQMIEFLTKKQSTNGVANISIDLVEPVQFNEQSLLIDPYVLGALIGDGGMTQNVTFTSADNPIIEEITGRLNDHYCLKRMKGSLYDYRLTLKDEYKSHTNIYIQHLRSMGLHGQRSHEKFIPDLYKYSSISQRIELIQGLFDTDGTVGKRGDVSYSTSSYALAKDVQAILWSLGAKCSIHIRYPFYRDTNGIKVDGKISYYLHVSYRYPKQLFKLDRKKNRCAVEYQSKQLRRQLVSVTKSSTEEAQCIMIDHPSHLYITDDYIITHNTYLATYLAIKDILVNKNFKRLLILRSPLSVNHQGYLPGTLEEKEAVYERPYRDIVTDLFQNKEMYDKLKEEHIIDFQTTSYIRGLTWNDTIVVADEVQNMLWEEINTIATRIGTNSKLVFLGDLAQNDITVAKRNQHSGMEKLLMIAKRIDKFDLVKFLPEDIVRGEFVKQWIIACEQYEEQFTVEKTSSK